MVGGDGRSLVVTPFHTLSATSPKKSTRCCPPRRTYWSNSKILWVLAAVSGSGHAGTDTGPMSLRKAARPSGSMLMTPSTG